MTAVARSTTALADAANHAVANADEFETARFLSE